MDTTTDTRSSNEGLHIKSSGISQNDAKDPSENLSRGLFPTSEATRAEVLRLLSSWRDDVGQAKRILWLHGEPGSWRASISQGIVDSLRSSGQFGGSFAFQKGVQGRIEGLRLFPAIASQLSANIPGLRKLDTEASSTESTPPLESLPEQFNSLIAEPIQELTPFAESFVIVIDGLDGTDDQDNVQQAVLRCVADSARSKLPLSYIIISDLKFRDQRILDNDTIRDTTLSIPLAVSGGPVLSSPSPTPDKISTKHRRRITKRPLQFASYPRIVTVQQRNGHAESYSRSLLLAGHGFPLWKPSGNPAARLEYRLKGVNIGDVGIIDENGYFQYYFNIFLPPDHPINKGYTPREFQPIEPALQSYEVTRYKEYFKPGHVIVSKGVAVNRHSDTTLDISFTSTEPEAAILVLPTGASREDVVSTERFHEYCRKNSPHWYQYINNYGRTAYANGSLFLVTGCDKTDDWALASYPYHAGNTVRALDLRYTWKPEYSPPWRNSGSAESEFYFPTGNMPVDCKEKNQCVFLRGLRISLTQASWQKSLPYMEEARRHYSLILSIPPKFSRLLNRLLVFLHFRLSEKRAIDIVTSENQHFFHPNFVISQVLLAEYPDAEIAVVDDSVWCSLVDNGFCTDIEMNGLVSKILQRYKIVESHGVISLKYKTTEDSKQLNSVSNSIKASILNLFPQVGPRKKRVHFVKTVPVHSHARLF